MRGCGADDELVSRVLVIALLLFLGLASSLLVWDGLAIGLAHGPELDRGELRRARVRFTTGVLVLAAVLWIALGMLTRAW